MTTEPAPDQYHIVHGSVSDFPAALLMLFAGENTGKLILALDRG